VATALHNPVVLAALAYMVAFNTIYALWGQSTMQAFLPSTEAAIVFGLEPVTAGVVGVYMIGEKLSGLQMVGAALIIVATISAEVRGSALRRKTILPSYKTSQQIL
jgi:drug/metabolite transporter (DMT)-like permease